MGIVKQQKIDQVTLDQIILTETISATTNNSRNHKNELLQIGSSIQKRHTPRSLTKFTINLKNPQSFINCGSDTTQPLKNNLYVLIVNKTLQIGFSRTRGFSRKTNSLPP